MLLCMRTTIDLPDPLFRRAKKAAAEQGVPLREIVVRALERALAAPAAAAPYRFAWTGVDLGVTPAGLLEDLLADQDRPWLDAPPGAGRRRR